MAVDTSHSGFVACATTNITSSAYIQIPFGSETVNPSTYPNSAISCSKMEITDTTGKILKIATGTADNQVDQFTCAPNETIIITNFYLPANTAIWAKAIDATNNASTGYLAVSLM